MLLLWIPALRSQQPDRDTLVRLTENIAEAFQADPHLIHGIRYYDLYPAAPGHPFFEPDEYRFGRVIINDREYKGLKLKYDICNQRLLLHYFLSNGGSAEIILIRDPIREFELDNKIFRPYTLPRKGVQFCQEIGAGSIKCLYFWHKELVPLNNSLESYNQYTSQEKNSWLLLDSVLIPFKGKRSFIRCFPASQHPVVKKYIRENHILIRHVSDAAMHHLIGLFEAPVTGTASGKEDHP